MAALWQNYEGSPGLETLGVTTKNLVKDWKERLLAFRLMVDKKYGTDLHLDARADRELV